MIADELLHQIKQLAQQTQTEFRPWVYGHISNYDPKTHKVRVILPTIRDEFNMPVLTGWMPLGTPFGGSGWGFQWAPYTGATQTQPTLGEQVKVSMNDRGSGLGAAPCMFWNDSNPPPMPGLGAGEAVLFHKSGSRVYLHANGDVEIFSATGNVNITSTSAKVTVAAATSVNVVAPLINLCSSLSDTLKSFCTTTFYNWAISHVHNDPQGGTTSTPTTAPGTGALTTVVQGE